MSEDMGLAATAAGTIFAAGVSLYGWLMNRVINRLDDDLSSQDVALKEHARLHTQCQVDLAQFKTKVAEEYAKDSTVQQSLARLHDRLDQGFREIREDIRSGK